ncbi:photoreceptor cilium actin regulator-like isoform X2 [Scyliorhinus canicula]|uniref:photoreceptor cilium actin regulator-like isoform X2 n=1 Tax=Scyliorhinus canicula TaxID=7830 RepID=UPI0018F5E03F|nr:photoreceptor cilium actin regulator-like isoform X2 [Scyliorhinus canicula]
MGCAPSQSEIIQHLAKHTLRPLRKATDQAPADKTHTESLTHSISGGSGNYECESNSSEDGQENISRAGKEERCRKERGCCQNLPPSAMPARIPKLYSEEVKREKLAAGAKVAVSEVIISRRYVPRDMPGQHTYCDSSATQQPKKNRKQKGHHTTKQKSGKLRERSLSRAEDEEKVDFPTSLVNAHQAAYAYLNTSLSKYDGVLSLTDQATQTQLILQQMVSFLTLRFDEVNQMLEEMASSGERLVKDIGPNLAWPPEKGAPNEQPDLLQQLLQYTVNKMQATSGTVASLTATTLQETCGYLRSAADTFQKRLVAKQEVDERLQRIIAQLEACALQQPHSKPGDMTLYSEDSGIGADTDSMKEFSNPDKYGRRTSSDSNAYLLCRDSLPHTSHKYPSLSNTAFCPSKCHDYAPDHQSEGIFYSSRKGKSSSSQPPVSVNPSQYSLIRNRSFGSFESVTSTDCEALSRMESMDFCSLGEEDYEESESEIAVDGTPQRPRSSPPEPEAVRPVPKRIDVPENEEMTIKMKDAISDKIQFVPINPGSNVWSDEEGKSCPARPNTAKGRKARVTKKRRSKSAESLKSKAEDPTMLELQRTQKDLSRRLEKMLQPKGEGEVGERQLKVMAGPKLPVSMPITDQAVPNNKLKASLHSNFSILPSQEKVLLRRNPARPSNQAQTKEQAARPNNRDLPKAKEEPTSPRPGATRPKQSGVQGLMDGPVAGESGGPEGLGSPLLSVGEVGDFPPPPSQLELELAADGSTAASEPRRACSVTRRLLASLDSVPLLPSKHPGGRVASGQGARNPRRLQAGGPAAAQQSWPPYKIINLRYSGGCCSSPENGPPGREAMDTSALCKAAPASPPSRRKLAAAAISPCPSHQATGSSALPAPTPPAMRKGFPSPPLPPRNLYRPAGYTTPSPSAARRNGPNPVWVSRQPNQPATQEELNSLSSPRKSSPPPVSRKLPCPLSLRQLPGPPANPQLPGPPANPQLPGPPANPQLPSPPANTQLPSPLANHQLPSPPTNPQLPSPPANHQLPSPPANQQLPSPPSNPQLPSPPSNHQLPSPPANPQLPSPPANPQLPSPPANPQLPSPPVNHQLPSPPVNYQLPSPPANHQLPSPPVNHQLPSPPANHQLPSPPVNHQLPSPPVNPQLPSPPANHQLPSPPVNPQLPSPPVNHQLPSPPANPQLPSPPANHQLSSPPANHQLPSPLSLRQLPSPPVNHQLLSTPANHQLPSPPANPQLPSPPANHQPSSPPTHRQPSRPPGPCQLSSTPTNNQLSSPLTHRKLPSPPAHRQLPSPPTHRQLPSPPTLRQLPSPPTHRHLSSPPTYRQLPSPHMTANTASPPVSLRKRPPDQPDAAHQSHCPGSNASSIFCLLSDSIFESQPPSPPVGAVNATAQPQNIILGDGSPMTSRAAWRNNFMHRQPGDRPRRLTLSGVHPQPFVKKNHLPDFKTGAQSRSPASNSAGSEPALHSIGLDGSFENEDDSWLRHYMSEMRGSSRSVSHPELCIIGQGLQ